MAEFRLGPHSMCNILKLHHFAFLLLSFYIPSLFFSLCFSLSEPGLE